MILLGVRSFTPQVANGVHTPRYMMHKKNANQTSPHETEEHTGPAAVQESTQQGGNQEPEQDPDGKESTRDTHGGDLTKILDIAIEIGGIPLEDPADVGMPKSANQAPHAPTAAVGRVRIVV